MGKKQLLTFLTICVLVGGTGIFGGNFALNNSSVAAKELVCTPSEVIAEEYAYDVDFTAPSATISYNGAEIVATKSVIIFPNGITRSETVRLNVEGEYTVIYYATVEGKTISAQKKFMVSTSVQDTIAPTIEIQASALMDAKVAKGETIVVPQAIAYDEHLLGEVAVNVYYNYGTPNQCVVAIVDGAFVPQQLGLYAIEYTAKDAFGLVTQETLVFNCAQSADNIAAKLTVENELKTKAGEEISLPSVSISGLYEGYEEYVRTYLCSDGEEQVEVFGTVKPEHVGEYEIVYRLETPLKTYEAVCKLTSTASDNVSFSEPYLPDYLIKDASYTFDEITALEYKEKDPTVGKVDVYAIVDGDEDGATKIDYANYKAEGASVQFLYKCGNKEARSKVIPVVDVGYRDGETFDIKEYFQGNFTKAADEDREAILYTSNVKEGNVTMDFINPLSYNFFAFEFTIPTAEDKSSIGAVVLTLTDFVDRDRKIEFRFENNAGFMCYSLNGAKAVVAGKPFEEEYYNFKFDVAQEKFLVGGEYFSADAFTGDRLLLSVTLEDVHGENATIAIHKIMNQAFTGDVTVDDYRPRVNAIDYTGLYKVNSVVSIKKAEATDALSPFCEQNFSMSIIAPDGTYVKTYGDGITLDGNQRVEDCQIELTQYGDYLIEYVYRDQWGGNREMAESTLFVEERIAPTIVIDGVTDGEIIQAEYLSVVKVAGFTVTDNVSKTENIVAFVEVYGPDSVRESLSERTFAATKKGEYTVVYTAFDELGNVTVQSYIVRVV